MNSYKGNEAIGQEQAFSPAIVELKDEELEKVVGGCSERREHDYHRDHDWHRHYRWHHEDHHHHYHHWW